MMTLDQVEAAGGYDVVLSDPPWSYDNKGRGSTDGKYEGMKLEEIAAMPISRLAAPNSVLFLWITWPFLFDAKKVLESWGFEYKTLAFLWVKYHEKSEKRCMGGGFWTRSNTEPCLLATRGDAPRRVDASIRQLIETGPEEVLLAPRGEHSAKPLEARDRIGQLMGDTTRIELFSRDRAEGWDGWGNQTPEGSDIYLGVPCSCKTGYVPSKIEGAGMGAFVLCPLCQGVGKL